jgi:hypothetical protein
MVTQKELSDQDFASLSFFGHSVLGTFQIKLFPESNDAIFLLLIYTWTP